MAESLLSLSEADSSRFKLKIVRGRIEEPEVCSGDDLYREILALQADVAVIRLPAGVIAPLRALVDRGLVPLHADTLVYHVRDLSEPAPNRRDEPLLTVELARPEDSTTVASIARQAFSSYRSHYHANHLFAPELITEGYAQWATSFLLQQSDDRETWVAKKHDKVVAFATSQLTSGEAEIVLNAVDPAHSGQGIYGYMLGKIICSYGARRFHAVRISTQVWNYTVQKAWARAGFVISRAYDTYHVNALLGTASRSGTITGR